VTVGGEFVGDGLAGTEARGVEAGVLVDRHGAVVGVGRGDEKEPAVALFDGEALLLVAGGQAAGIGQNPNLQEMDAFASRGVELAVGDTGAADMR